MPADDVAPPLLALALLVAACRPGGTAEAQRPPDPPGPSVAPAERAAPRGDGPRRLLVHVDNVRPDKVAQFESSRTKFVEDLKARGVDDRRGHYFKVGDGRFLSVVAFRTFADLDALFAARSAAQGEMKGLIEEYGRLADEGLVFPHHNELWTERLDLSWTPTGRLLEAASQLVVEEVDPTCDYAEAWRSTVATLDDSGYPLERRAFSSSYGSGKVMAFWLGPSTGAPPVPAPPPCVRASEPTPVRFMEAMSLP